MSEIKYPDTLKEITAFCRKNGIEHLKIGDFEIILREEAPPSNYKRKLEVASSPEKPERELTEEDYLLWSVQEEAEASA